MTLCRSIKIENTAARMFSITARSDIPQNENRAEFFQINVTGMKITGAGHVLKPQEPEIILTAVSKDPPFIQSK